MQPTIEYNYIHDIYSHHAGTVLWYAYYHVIGSKHKICMGGLGWVGGQQLYFEYEISIETYHQWSCAQEFWIIVCIKERNFTQQPSPPKTQDYFILLGRSFKK